MNKKRRKKIHATVLVITMILTVISVSISAFADSVVTKDIKTYEVAVVYDNSGSMYSNGKNSWCKAKYSMEIFANMLNYSCGDVLKIYPMWDVTTDGSTNGGSHNPIVINSSEDIKKIHDMYTVKAQDTPLAPVKEAYKNLKESKANEKWLIVLTDGEFNRDERNSAKTEINIKNELKKRATDGIKVQYLGIGKEALKIESDENRNFYASNTSDAELSEELVNICNKIFKRTEYPGKIKNGRISLDMSMNALIVFVQGKNAEVQQLIGSNEIPVSEDSGEIKYSELSCGNYRNASIDTNLAGRVVSFGACEKGAYNLKYVGGDSIKVYYEPDVDIKVEFFDESGDTVDTSAEAINQGNYTVEYSLVDGKTGEDVSKSDLLGKVKLSAKLVNSDGSEQDVANGGTVTLKPDEQTFIEVTGKYLDDYTITTRDNESAYTFRVANTDKVEVVTYIKEPHNWFSIKKHNEWQPVRVDVTLGGKKLTDEQLVSSEINIFSKNNIKYKVEPINGESAYNVYLGQDSAGNYIEPKTGKQKIKTVATVDDGNGSIIEGSATDKIKVKKYPWIVDLLAKIIGIILLLLLILWWTSHKSFPKKMYFVSDMGSQKYKIGKSMDLTPAHRGEIKCTAVKTTPHISRNSKSAKLKIKEVTADAKVKSVIINNQEFIRNGQGKLVNDSGKELGEMDFTIGNGTHIEWQTNRGRRSGTIYMNKKASSKKSR